MLLYGSYTSPFVRRVRIVAAELGEPVELVDTSTSEGQETLSRVHPLWKVPVAVIDGETWFDSRVICDRLMALRGPGPLRVGGGVDDINLRTVADGVLDSAINWFYLVRRDGADVDLPYLRKQRLRVDASLEWLAERCPDPSLGLGLTEIALVTALDWLAFRDVWPVARHPVLGPFAAAWATRPSFLETMPVA
jgi:glutathione S-transferase